MNTRIKELRKELQMTQKDFAAKIKVSPNSIARYELGDRKPSDAIINSICREFNINEDWLRTGSGEMYTSINPDERYASNVGKLQRTDDEIIINWVNAIAETSPEVLKQVEEFMKKILDIK